METGAQPWALADPSDIKVELESGPDAALKARAQVNLLADRLPLIVLADLRTIVSELVTNCVKHGSGRSIELSIEVAADGSIRGCVSDGGDGPVAIPPPRPAGDGGLGLRIVDVLVSRWGVCAPTSDVWFELAPQFQRAHGT